MFGQLLPNKNKKCYSTTRAVQRFRDAPNRASKPGQSHRGMEIPCLLLQHRHRKIKVSFSTVDQVATGRLSPRAPLLQQDQWLAVAYSSTCVTRGSSFRTLCSRTRTFLYQWRLRLFKCPRRVLYRHHHRSPPTPIRTAAQSTHIRYNQSGFAFLQLVPFLFCLLLLWQQQGRFWLCRSWVPGPCLDVPKS
jgi:hypothetical protein